MSNCKFDLNFQDLPQLLLQGLVMIEVVEYQLIGDLTKYNRLELKGVEDFFKECDL